MTVKDSGRSWSGAMMNMSNIYREMANMSDPGNASVNGTLGSLNPESFMNRSLNFIAILVLFITMVSLGCTMELSRIKAHFLSPKGVAIAMVSQFGIMPFTAFCLAKILQMGQIQTVTVLICGCCPGGSLSNILTLAVQGDMNLSILLTTCSSFAALALMPLLLYIYCQAFPGLEKAVPFVSIITTLVLTLVPCSMGIAINHFRPKYSPVVKKVGLGILIVAGIILVFLTFAVIKDKIWISCTPENMAVAALMPLTGYILGYGLSFVCRLSKKCCRTISMETGCQNIQLCFAILKVAFPLAKIGPMFFFPLMYMGFQCAEALFFSLCLRCYKTVRRPAEDKPYSAADVKPEGVNQAGWIQKEGLEEQQVELNPSNSAP